MDKVQIDIEENEKNRRKYAAVALTVDREDFLSEIHAVRHKFNADSISECPHTKKGKEYFESFLSRKLDNRDILRLWFANHFGILFKIMRDDWEYEPDPNEQIQHNTAELNELISLLGRRRNPYANDLSSEFSQTITFLRRKLHTTQRMERIIAHAIICNRVTEGDLVLAYAEEEYESPRPKTMIQDFSHFHMHISREATLDDIIEAYRRDIVPRQKHSRGLDTTVPFNTKDEIIRDRERYWLHKSGLTHKEIAISEHRQEYMKAEKIIHATKDALTQEKTNQRIDAQDIFDKFDYMYAPTIKKSIARYRKLLRKTITNLSNNF